MKKPLEQTIKSLIAKAQRNLTEAIREAFERGVRYGEESARKLTERPTHFGIDRILGLPQKIKDTLFDSEIYDPDFYREPILRTGRYTGKPSGPRRSPVLTRNEYRIISNALERAIYMRYADIREPVTVYAHDLLKISAVRKLVSYVEEKSQAKSVGKYLYAIRKKKYSRIEIEKDTLGAKKYVIKPIDYELVAKAAEEIVKRQKRERIQWVNSIQVAALIRDPTINTRIGKNLAEWARKHSYKSVQIGFESYGRIKVYYKGPKPPLLK